MSHRFSTDNNAFAKFEKTLRNLPETRNTTLTLKEQIENERQNELKRIQILNEQKEAKERDRFIQDCPFFER